jgi:hypothetical protein
LVKSLRDPILKKPITKKRAGEVAEDIGPEFKPKYHQRKKRKYPIQKRAWGGG